MSAALILDTSGALAPPLRQHLPDLELHLAADVGDACEQLDFNAGQFDVVVARLPEGHQIAQAARSGDSNLGVLLLSRQHDAQASQRELMFLNGISPHVVSLPQDRLDLVLREVTQVMKATQQRRRHRGLLNRSNALLPANRADANSREALQEALRQSETRQRKLIIELEAALKLRDQFLTIAAHELRTPITAIRLTIDSARRLVTEGRGAAKLETLARLERRLNQLVEVLLDVSRLQMGRRKLNLEPVDLVELTREMLERFELERARSGSIVTLETPASVTGSWDRLGLESILSNLLSNGLKYGRGGAIDVRITQTATTAEVRVADHGIGIAAADLAKLFAPFVRAVAETQYGGFGVGLWIARSIAEIHGGSLSATSAAGEGTEFFLSLPRTPSGGNSAT